MRLSDDHQYTNRLFHTHIFTSELKIVHMFQLYFKCLQYATTILILSGRKSLNSYSLIKILTRSHEGNIHPPVLLFSILNVVVKLEYLGITNK